MFFILNKLLKGVEIIERVLYLRLIVNTIKLVFDAKEISESATSVEAVTVIAIWLVKNSTTSEVSLTNKYLTLIDELSIVICENSSIVGATVNSEPLIINDIYIFIIEQSP